MTQEEKAKRYDEALEELRGLLEGIREEKCKILEEDITSIFPELLENEDERIRKELIFYLGDMPEDTELRNGVTNRDVLVWLEKQGEQKFAEWSKEDEAITLQIEQIIKCAHFLNIVPEKLNKINKWLKSLKQRIKE